MERLPKYLLEKLMGEQKINKLLLDNRALRFQNEKLQKQIELYEGILENIFIEVN